MNTNFSNELLNISAQFMTTTDKVEIIRLTNRLNNLAAEAITAQDENSKNVTTIFLHLTKKEIAEMPKTFRKEFIAEGCVCRTTKRPSGKGTFCYECRYRRNGYNVSASATNPEEAKQKFIEKLKEALKDNQAQKKSAMLFNNIAEEWFEHRKTQIVAGTFRNYYSYYSRYILPTLKGRYLDKIRTCEIGTIMQQVDKKGRAYEDIRSILNQIFEYARHNGLIRHNPVTLIPFIKSERTHGEALEMEEERILIKKLNESNFSKFKQPILAMLYFGLRPCELSNAKIENGFMIAQNRKRKNGKIEYKKIPISPVAMRYIDINAKNKADCCDDLLRRIFKRILPNRTLYDLRHTFASRCQMFVRQEIVEIWLGDSPTRLIGNTYTHFSDNFLLSEMQKVDYLL